MKPLGTFVAWIGPQCCVEALAIDGMPTRRAPPLASCTAGDACRCFVVPRADCRCAPEKPNAQQIAYTPEDPEPQPTPPKTRAMYIRDMTTGEIERLWP